MVRGGTSFSVTDGPGGPFIPETDGLGGPLTRGTISSMTGIFLLLQAFRMLDSPFDTL